MEKEKDRGIIFVFVIFWTVLILIFSLWFTDFSFADDGVYVITGVNRGKIIGQIYPVNLTSDETLSGSCLYGAWITSGTSDVTVSGVTSTFPSGTGQGENVFFYLSNDTAQSGTTINIHWPAGDNIISADAITAGTSKLQLSGTTLEQRVVVWSSGVSEWTILTVGSPDVDWD